MYKKELPSFIRWFSELRNKDISIAGGKGASLAEMYSLKLPIPPGFIITAQAYEYFLEKANLTNKINSIISRLDVNNTSALDKASKEIRELIENSSLPKELEEEILEAYDILSSEDTEASELLSDKENSTFVAVRSSATTEDLSEASFAGQQESFLNVRGHAELILKVKKCASSLFTPRAIYYRNKKGFAKSNALLAVVIQKMINSKKSGVIFSQNPMGSKEGIVIEAVFGLGEGIVSGQIKPDHYEISVDLEKFEIIKEEISEKKIAFSRDKSGQNITIKLDEETANRRVLDNYELKRLAQYAKLLEEHYKKPQDIEFAIDSKGIYIVQSRPITTIFKEEETALSGGKVILSGLGASPGISSGIVRIVHSLADLEKVKQGDVLVTEMTNPDMVVSMQKAAAIVTNEGGVTSHAAIVSREMGIPCVVGTGNATSLLKEGSIITVDANSGKIFEGKSEAHLVEIKPIVPTRTEIKVILDLPDFAERAAKSEAKSVGLTRLEGIIAEAGKHPYYFVKAHKMSDYVKLISKGIKTIVSHFEEAWIRTSDIRSDEFGHLQGAPELKESNPMLGDHGIRFSLKHLDIMRAEIQAIKEVALIFPRKKLGIMVPQVISLEELQKTKSLAKELKIPSNVKIGIMVETPAAVQIIESLCAEGLGFISFGTNDLTQYTLAIDRNNEHVQHLYNEMHPAVLNSLSKVIQVCKKYNVKTSICGQAASKEEMASFLVSQGIDSLSVNADAAHAISLAVAKIEASAPLQFTLSASLPVNKKSSPRTPKGFRYTFNPPVLTASILNFMDNSPEHKDSFGYSDSKDIEDIILNALDGKDEYSPGTKDKKEDIPKLNDSIPVFSDFFNDEK